MADLNPFEETYRLPVLQANHWKNINYAYAEYQKIGKDAFEKELNYRVKLEEFKQTYGKRVRRANNWTTTEYAYQDYQKIGKDAFEKELNYRINIEEFGQEFYEELRELSNVDYEAVQSYYDMMVENKWTYEDFRKYIESFNEESDEEEEEDKYDDESNWVVCCECEGFLEKEEHKNYDNKSIPENKVGLSIGQVAPICTRCQEEYCNECAGKCNGDCNACTDKEED